MEITSLLIEGGALVNGAALASGEVDKVFLYYAPKILGEGAVPFIAGEGLRVAGVSAGSPAQAAGLEAGDRITEIEGAKATVKSLSDRLTAAKPGEGIHLRVSRDGAERLLEIPLGRNAKSVFTIVPIENPDPLQAAIGKDWMRKTL